MRCGCGTRRLPFLGVSLFLFYSPLLYAQSSDNSPNCPLTPGQQALLRHLSHQDERPRVVIDAVSFEGEISLPEEQRQELAAEIRNEELFAGTDWEGRAETLAKVVWENQGFFTASVHVTSQPLRRDGSEFHYNLNLKIEEGARYYLKAIRLENANPEVRTLTFPLEQLRQLIPIQDGDLFAPGKIRAGLGALRNLYAQHGYIEFTAQLITDVDREHRLVSVTVQLDKQVQYRIGGIYTLGADPQMEALLHSSFIPGEIFNNQVLTDFFKANELRLPPDVARQRVAFDRDPILRTVTLRIDLRPCPDPEF